MRLIPSFARRGKGGFNYFSKPLPPPLAKGRILRPVTESL
jgi:hypothetical protein